jgi:NO-binding membrane sensor protein with MHYT domain
MHYIGMAALMLDGSIIWDRRIVGLSVVIAVVASGTALWLAFRLRDKGFLSSAFSPPWSWVPPFVRCTIPA